MYRFTDWFVAFPRERKCFFCDQVIVEGYVFTCRCRTFDACPPCAQASKEEFDEEVEEFKVEPFEFTSRALNDAFVEGSCEGGACTHLSIIRLFPYVAEDDVDFRERMHGYAHQRVEQIMLGTKISGDVICLLQLLCHSLENIDTHLRQYLDTMPIVCAGETYEIRPGLRVKVASDFVDPRARNPGAA